MVSYGTFPKFYPRHLLTQLASCFTSGCLQVSDGLTSWLIYLDQGKLVYATNSVKPFERLDRHLRQMNRQVPTLERTIRVQARLLFEAVADSRSTGVSADYRAIRWLVEQQHLNVTQATMLIEAIAQEVLESFLTLTEATHELIDKEKLDDYPKLCQIDLQSIIGSDQEPVEPLPPEIKPWARSSEKLNLFQRHDGELSHEVEVLQEPSSSSEDLTEAINPPWAIESDYPTFRNAPAQSSKSHYIIACIDDSPVVLKAIKSFLDDASFTVIMINDPIKALMQVIRSKPDVILLDVGMPNLDGYELCSLLRRHPSFKNTPIIMVTGNTGFIDRAKAKLVGASGYLTKPFTQPELLKMVFKHLS
jgi:twitching motility two-component system response regulator PilG